MRSPVDTRLIAAVLLATFLPWQAASAGASVSAQLTVLLAENQCKKLGVLYAHYADLGEPEKVAQLFTKDAHLIVGPKPIVGREEILATFQAIEKSKTYTSRHVITNHLVTLVSETEAIGVSYLTLYRFVPDSESGDQNGHPITSAVYEDSYLLTDSGWQIKSRVAKPAFIHRNPTET